LGLLLFEPGEEKQLDFTIEARQFSTIDNNGKRVLEPGEFSIFVGGRLEGFTEGLATEIEIIGSIITFRF